MDQLDEDTLMILVDVLINTQKYEMNETITQIKEYIELKMILMDTEKGFVYMNKKKNELKKYFHDIKKKYQVLYDLMKDD